MTDRVSQSINLEVRLAQLLGYGTWLGCAVIAIGLILPALGQTGSGMRVLTAGIGLFIALPVLRVASMLAHFLRAGDTRFAAISALVLAVIFAGISAGFWQHA
jgi:uncharacterized membrane protein